MLFHQHHEVTILSTLSTNIEVAHFVFETVMRVRNTEIGLGQHLTVENLVALITEARFRFYIQKALKRLMLSTKAWSLIISRPKSLIGHGRVKNCYLKSVCSI